MPDSNDKPVSLGTETAYASDPESILLYGIECIATSRPASDGNGGFMIMDAISANRFASEILLHYWKAKAALS